MTQTICPLMQGRDKFPCKECRFTRDETYSDCAIMRIAMALENIDARSKNIMRATEKLAELAG